MAGRLIGLGGYAGVGKDAVANILENEHGFTNVGAYSLGVHECLLTLNPHVKVAGDDYVRYAELWIEYSDPGRGFEDPYAEFKKVGEVRHLMQIMGTEVGRNMIGENVWVAMKWTRDIGPVLLGGGDVVLTGVRYQNEIDLIREVSHRAPTATGHAWWVYRPGFGPINAHTSDNALDDRDFDSVIFNDGTLEDLVRIVGVHLT